MPTKTYTVNSSSWTYIGDAPCVVDNIGSRAVLIYQGTTAPTTDVDHTLLKPSDDDGYLANVTGDKVWAKALSGLDGLGTVAVTPRAASSSSSSSAITVADGADVTLGAKADAAAGSDTASASLMSVLRRGLSRWTTLLSVVPNGLGRAAATLCFRVVLSNEDLAALVAAGPGFNGFVITPSDSTNFTTNARAIYVGVGGDVNLVTPSGVALLHKNVAQGSTLAIGASRVNATGTTASSLIGYI